MVIYFTQVESTNIEGTKQQVIQIQHKYKQNYKNRSLDQDKPGARDETGKCKHIIIN